MQSEFIDKMTEYLPSFNVCSFVPSHDYELWEKKDKYDLYINNSIILSVGSVTLSHIEIYNKSNFKSYVSITFRKAGKELNPISQF